MKRIAELVVVIRGAGEVASGVAYRLHKSGMKVCLTEVARPLAVCRGVTFSEAVFDGSKEIMGVVAQHVNADKEAVQNAWQRGKIPVIIDPGTDIRAQLKSDVVIDALMTKRNSGIEMSWAPLVIGLGPGFAAGRDVHLVVETSHEHELGRVLTAGEAARNTGTPVTVGGLSRERVVWAEKIGVFTTDNEIGDAVEGGQVVGWIDDEPVMAPLSGMLRGLLRSGVPVVAGSKVIEVDHVNDPEICGLIADKIRVIAEGVFMAIKTRYDV